MSLPEPPVLTALKALTACLEGISTATGYRHNLAGAVFRGRMLYGADDPLPLISIQQIPRMPEEVPQPKGRGASARLSVVPLLIQGFAEDDRANPLDPAYLLMDDVERRLALEIHRDEGFNTFGLGTAVQMDLGDGVVRSPDEAVSGTAFFWLPVTLEVANNVLAGRTNHL